MSTNKQSSEIKNNIPASVTLIAVSKGQSVEKMKEAIDAGLKCFGENYVQEFLEKWNELPKDIQWHFIGHLQTNKVKYIIDKVVSIDSVDSLKLYEVIRKEAQKIQKKISVLIEINVGEEKTKSGVLPQELPDFLKSLPKSPYIEVCGLMTIPPFSNIAEDSRPYFKKMVLLQKEANLKELSIGMTHDYKIAIEEGATQIRIGEGIFGARKY